VWDVLDDVGGVSNYHPNVESSRVVNDIETGEGARRECRFADGGRIEETISAYTPGEDVVEFTDVGSYPLRSDTVEIRLRALDDHHTEVTFTSRFTPKYGPLGWLLGRAVMGRQFERRLDAVFEGLATHLHAEGAGGEGHESTTP
jgi:hypothetical protein